MTLRETLDAHHEYEDSAGCHCFCGWSTDVNDHHAAWLDHMERAIRAVFGWSS